MSPEEKIEAAQKLIDEARAEIAAKKRNWPEKIEAGMVFRKDCGPLYIAHTCERGEVDNLVCISGHGIGANWVFRKLFDGDESRFTYLGHARDILKIADDAHEPTGAELVGEVCVYTHDSGRVNDDGWICEVYEPGRGYSWGTRTTWYKHARIAR